MRRRPAGTCAGRTTANALAGLALEVGDLFGLGVSLVLLLRELVLGVALALLLQALATGIGVAGDVAYGLLCLATDLVCETHGESSCSLTWTDVAALWGYTYC